MVTGAPGLSNNRKPCYSEASRKEKWKLIQKEICFSRIVAKWEHTAGRKITCELFWKVQPHH